MPMTAPTFALIRFEAADGVLLTGFLTPRLPAAVAIYLHGLGGNGCRSSMIPALAAALGRRKIGLFSINTRGADLVATRQQGRKRTPYNGAVHEIFTECRHDIRGAMAYLRSRGVRRIYLIGHSTGANKIAYALQRGIEVAKVVYLAPGDDVGIQRQLLGEPRFRAMQRLAARLRKSDPHRLMPVKNLGYLDVSAASYHSLFGASNRMDQFPLTDLRWRSRWQRLARSKIPALLVLGAADEYSPVPAAAIADFFARHLPRIDCTVVPQANHSFTGVESLMARRVAQFLSASRIHR